MLCKSRISCNCTGATVLTILDVVRKAQRYTYYVTEMYGRHIRKDFVVVSQASVWRAPEYKSIAGESDPLVAKICNN